MNNQEKDLDHPNKTFPIHLVGSVPLADAGEVFNSVTDSIGKYVHAVPDGETGNRSNWLLWQEAVFRQCPQLESIETKDDYSEKGTAFHPKNGTERGDIDFGELGYARIALESYQLFREMKDQGRFNIDTRFQVSLPTPLAVAQVFFTPECLKDIEICYEKALMQELAKIIESVPANQLAIQWDVAIEIMMLELDEFPAHFPEKMKDIVSRLCRLIDVIPPEVTVGLHLCYGDTEHKHFKEPEDTGILVSVSNEVSRGANRTLDWIHMPVPIDRLDDSFYTPLKELRLNEETLLYLGLVHYSDGVEGTQKRINVAQKFTPKFGIATECGFGRRDPATVQELLKIHADVACNSQ